MPREPEYKNFQKIGIYSGCETLEGLRHKLQNFNFVSRVGSSLNPNIFSEYKIFQKIGIYSGCETLEGLRHKLQNFNFVSRVGSSLNPNIFSEYKIFQNIGIFEESRKKSQK